MTKTQSNSFLSLLAQANSLRVNGTDPRPFSCTFADENGQSDNEVVHIAYLDDGGFPMSTILTEGGIANGKWEGDDFICEDHEGDQVKLSLYRHVALRPDKAAKMPQGRTSDQPWTMPEDFKVPEGFADNSWRQDVCPSICNLKTKAVIYWDTLECSNQRLEFPSGVDFKRFTVHSEEQTVLASTNDLDEAIAAAS